MRLAATVTVLTLFGASTALAQAPAEKYAGRPIAELRLVIDGAPVTESVITDLVETRVGSPLSLSAVRESIVHLYSLGRFQDIQVDATDAGNGSVVLAYNLVPMRAVERVQFRGTLGLPAGVLRDAVEERFGRTPQVGRAAEAARTLERLYQDRGYFKASVRAVATELENPRRTFLTFEIDAGPRARIGAVELLGDPRTPREQLLSRLGVTPGRPYERVELQNRLTEYVQRLTKQGHLQATASHTARIADDGTVADLTLDVQAGPIVTVTYLGDQLPRDARDELVPFQREGSADEDLIEDASQRIREYFQQQGYWKADVRVEPQQTNDTLTIAFTIRKGPLYRLAPDGVEITGNQSIPAEELRPLVLLAPGEPYIASHLDAAEGAITRLYRARGFAWVQVKPSENEVAVQGVDSALLRPLIAISEGPRAVVGAVTITGAQALSEEEIRRVARLVPGEAYYEPTVRNARDAVELEYRDLGFSSVQLAVVPSVSEDRTRVDLTFEVNEGPQSIVDHIIIVGNTRTAEDVIRREVVLKPGAPLGLRDVLESRRRLSQLGLFRRFDIRELQHGPPTRRDVLITVEEAPATSLGYGGGLEVQRRLRATGPNGEAEERIEFAPRGFFDIGRRNLFGKNRSVNLFTRVSVRPKDVPDNPDEDGSGFELSEYRVVGTYRQPRAWRQNADVTFTGALEQGIRSSFSFRRKGVGAELLHRLTPQIRMSTRYSFGTTESFAERLSDEEQAAIDRLFPQVRLSMFAATIARDSRDDVVDPARGMLISGEASLASRALGGQVGFLKTFMQGSWFRQVTTRRRLIVATRAALGLADGFEREPDPDNPLVRPIEDLPGSERFFAGGDTTVRGFALDTVGAPNTISPRGFPRGGNAVILLNGELRMPVWKDFGAVAFVDGGNVFERVTQFDIGALRGSVGFGLRYRSPIGPIRVDLGFKVDRRESEKLSVLHFSIGQAF